MNRPHARRRRPLSFDEWLTAGIDAGFCTTPVCDTHDGSPLTETEWAEFDEGFDPCIPVVRLWPEGKPDAGV